MCGIAGFVTDNASADWKPVLSRMTCAIQHRGPDDAGFYNDQRAYLGHRRLSIVDLSGGHQPMYNEDRSKVIVYNGEIFNHNDVRPALEQAGHRYESRCDTETILHAYEEHGPACLQLFRGMFAFVIWDQRAKTLFGARDRLGIKPFYYYWDGRLFAFASEIKALLEHPAISPLVEEQVLPEYLAFGYVSEERTLFRGIRKLMPGHWLRLNCIGPQAELQIERYWDVPPVSDTGSHDDAWWIAETRRRLEETVRMRLMSDVPLGMFLSGGLDSSAVTALVTRMVPGPVQTFAVGYNETAWSELDYARTVANHLGTEHHEVTISMQNFLDAVPHLIWHEDEPITWPSSVSLYFVARLAAERVKVVLTGEGSDELFAGYERYRWNLLNQKAAAVYRAVPGSLRAAIRMWIANSKLLNASIRRKLKHTVVGRELGIESLFLDNFYGAFSREEQVRLLASSPDRVYSAYLQYWNSRRSDPALERMLYSDQKTYLVELLMKQDQMSMACSIESRVPFLDHTFVEFARSIPHQLKIRGSEQKYILKKAVEDLLPSDIVYRTKKGFPTPIRDWLRDARSQYLLDDLSARDGFLSEYLDLGEVRNIVERHRRGREDMTLRLWSLINLQLWGEIYIRGRKSEFINSGLKPAYSR